MKVIDFLYRMKRRNDKLGMPSIDLDEALDGPEQLQHKLSKAQSYITELEERLKEKEDNGWMRK